MKIQFSAQMRFTSLFTFKIYTYTYYFKQPLYEFKYKIFISLNLKIGLLPDPQNFFFFLINKKLISYRGIPVIWETWKFIL